MYFGMFLSNFCSIKVCARYCMLMDTCEFLPHKYQFLKNVNKVQKYNDTNVCLFFNLHPKHIEVKECVINDLSNLNIARIISCIISCMNIIEYTADPPCIIKNCPLNIKINMYNIKFTRYDSDDVFIIQNQKIHSI
jgi:hypothetical protein